MRATSIAYLDSLACQKHLFSSLAATVLEKTVNTLKHVRNVTDSVTVVTSSALYASLNKHLLNKTLPRHKVVLDVVPANATFFEACGAIKAHLSHANYFVWRPISPFITPNVVEHCVHNVLANKGQLSLPVREFNGFSDFQSGSVRLTQSGHWTKQFIAFNSKFDFSEDEFCFQLMNKQLRVFTNVLETLDVTCPKELTIIRAMADNLIGADL
jgi:hypothetical protein